MASPLGTMVMEMITDGSLDDSLVAIVASIASRRTTLSPVSPWPQPSPSLFARKDRVVVGYPKALRGVTGTVLHRSKGAGRWVVEIDPAHRLRAEPYMLKRYPDCVSLPENCITKTP